MPALPGVRKNFVVHNRNSRKTAGCEFPFCTETIHHGPTAPRNPTRQRQSAWRGLVLQAVKKPSDLIQGLFLLFVPYELFRWL